MLGLNGGPKNESLYGDVRELSETGWILSLEESLALSFLCVKKRIESAMLVYAMVLLLHIICHTSATAHTREWTIYLLAAAMVFRVLSSLMLST